MAALTHLRAGFLQKLLKESGGSNEGIYASGTMRTNRKMFPDELKSAARQGLASRGDMIWQFVDNTTLPDHSAILATRIPNYQCVKYSFYAILLGIVFSTGNVKYVLQCESLFYRQG